MAGNLREAWCLFQKRDKGRPELNASSVGSSEEGNLELWLRKAIKTRRSEGLKMTEQECWDIPSNREI